MSNINFTEDTENILISLSKNRNIFLEGNILKVITTENEPFQEYLNTALKNDENQRKKRLEITRR